MGNRAQRKKERHEQRRKEKRKKQEQTRARRQEPERVAAAAVALVAIGSNARHRQRLSDARPQVWPGERPEDAAVFDDVALASLSPELAPQATAVREALQEALESRGDDAQKRMAAIPRVSPYSEWRLFIRGLTAWLADDPDAAGETWKRLDLERRPGRIATTMMVALRSDLEGASSTQSRPGPAEPGDASTATAWNCFDAQQLYHAKLLRRVRFDRMALRVAEAGLNVPEEGKALLLGPRKIRWIEKFIAEYGDTEPELAAALAQTALGRAFAQNYSDIFDTAVRMFPGPKHDPRNRLLGFYYFSRFGNDHGAQDKADQDLDEYLKRDLPKNEAVSPPLRGAIAGQIHYNEAMHLMRPARGGMADLIFGSSEDVKGIRSHLLDAAKAAPTFAAVYKSHAEWVESMLEEDRLTKPRRAQLETELAGVMRRWAEGRPDDVEPRLWLVDHLLEDEKLEEARPHVEFLAASRQDDPRVRATPWKWQVLEAMRLCRRKARLADVPARLDEVEKLWPTWLSKNWLPYLRAALLMRGGRTEAFEEERRRISEASGRARDSLGDACMMLGAAQQMRVPAAELKPLREVVDRAVKKIDALPLENLLDAAGFFWDMQRVQLLYPAARMHGGAIGKALFARLEKDSKRILAGLDDERIQKAVLWGAESRFWTTRYDLKLPSFFSKPAVKRHPFFMAAKLNAFLKQHYHWGVDKFQDLGPPLREAAASQRDPYYRRWFVQLAEQLDDVMAEEASRFSRLPFGRPFGDYHDDDDDDDFDDDDEGDDPDCDCPNCRAARKAREQASSSRTSRR